MSVPVYRQLGDINRETEKLMPRVISGDTGAMHKVLDLSRKREALLCAKPSPFMTESQQDDLRERRAKAVDANRKMDRFANGGKTKGSGAVAIVLIALGFAFGVGAALLIQ